MSKETARVALLNKVKLVWPAEYGPLSIPNFNFTIPNNSRWASLRMNDFGTQRMSLSMDFLKRNQGSLQFDLYCPTNIGSKENTVASDYLEDAFESLVLVTSDGEQIVFGTPASQDTSGVQERQEGTNSNWYRRIVDCPFYRDSQVSK